MDSGALRRMPNLLRKCRRIAGFKQKDVARILGHKNSSSLSRWENGKQFPSLRNLLKLSVLYWTLPEALYIDHVRALREEIYRREREVLPSSLQEAKTFLNSSSTGAR